MWERHKVWRADGETRELIREGEPVMSPYKKHERGRKRRGKCLRSFSHNSLHAASHRSNRCPHSTQRPETHPPQLCLYPSSDRCLHVEPHDDYRLIFLLSGNPQIAPTEEHLRSCWWFIIQGFIRGGGIKYRLKGGPFESVQLKLSVHPPQPGPIDILLSYI